MTGIYTTDYTGSAAVAAQGVEAIPSSTGEVLGAAAGGGLAQAFPTVELGAIGAQDEIDPVTGFPTPRIYGGAMLPAEDANAKYGIKGRLNFTAPVPDLVARDMSQRKHELIAREDIISRREPGLLTGGAARFGAGLVGGLPGLVDPLNLAASFIPVVPEARAAILAARGGIAGRFATGAAGGAFGQTLLTPLQYGLARHEQEDYGATDALLNIALGGLFGGGLHTLISRTPLERASPETPRPGSGIAGAGDATRLALDIERASPDTRAALLRSGIADIADGERVDSPAIVWDRSAYLDEPAATPGAAQPFESVPRPPQRLSEFLRQAGGLRDQGGELGDMNAARARPGLVNRQGLTLDDAALKAWEAGYLPGADRPDINTLIDHLDQDLRGKPVYSDRDAFAAAAHEDALARNAEIDRLSRDYAVPTQGKTQAQFYDAVAAADRVRATAEAERQQASADAIMRQAADDGWLPDFDETRDVLSAEDIAHAYRQETDARAAAARRYGVDEPGAERRTAGATEAGLRPGERGAGDRRRADQAREFPGDAGIERELAAPLPESADQLAAEIAQLEREVRQGLAEGETPPELEAADRQLREAEAYARATEQGGICLGRRL